MILNWSARRSTCDVWGTYWMRASPSLNERKYTHIPSNLWIFNPNICTFTGAMLWIYELDPIVLLFFGYAYVQILMSVYAEAEPRPPLISSHTYTHTHTHTFTSLIHKKIILEVCECWIYKPNPLLLLIFCIVYMIIYSRFWQFFFLYWCFLFMIHITFFLVDKCNFVF